MKCFIVISIVAICAEIGFALPTKQITNLKGSGVVCEVNDKGDLVECDEVNSKIPDDVKVTGEEIPNKYVCLDLTYKTGLIFKTTHTLQQCANERVGVKLCQTLKKNNDVSQCIETNPAPKPTPEPPSGLYCIVDEDNETVECNRENSKLPDDLKDDDIKKSSEFTCLDVTYKTGIFPLMATHHIQQCARKLVGDYILCDVLEDENNVNECTESLPYNTPTVEPPSNMFCDVDEDGFTIECNKANSRLPQDVKIGSAKESSNYVCLSLKYETGLWPLSKTYNIRQCAHQLIDADLCDVLSKKNSVDACRYWKPASPTAAPTTAAPTTAAPTTAAPTTAAPTTAAPTTAAPTTAAPTTAAPTTAAPTTAAPTTAAPTTAAPTTAAPTTAAPTTAAPTTAVPTTAAPTTAAPTTAAPTTAAPTVLN